MEVARHTEVAPAAARIAEAAGSYTGPEGPANYMDYAAAGEADRKESALLAGDNGHLAAGIDLAGEDNGQAAEARVVADSILPAGGDTGPVEGSDLETAAGTGHGAAGDTGLEEDREAVGRSLAEEVLWPDELGHDQSVVQRHAGIGRVGESQPHPYHFTPHRKLRGRGEVFWNSRP